MSEQATWFVMQGDEQLGPYTGEQLVEYAGNGSITRETMVWAEGMENWIPAAQVDNLFPAATQTAPVQAAPGQPALGQASPYQTPGSNLQTAPAYDGEYPNPGVKAASFGMWAGFLIGGIVLIIAGLFALGATAESTQADPDPDAGTGMAMVALALMGIGYVLCLVSAIITYIYIYRAWQCLQPGGLARSTPGKAVGFLFIPLFNLYWMFQAFHGLATDWNRTVSSFTDLHPIPRLSEGTFLAFCICAIVFYPVNLILIFIVMSQITKGINAFAYRPKPHQPGTAGFTLG